MTVMRYGVIGTSWITRSMITGAKQHVGLQLTAVCSRDRERGEAFAAEYGGARVFTDPAAMAQSDAVDMVYIASPNRCHIAQSRLFLQAGKHVLCEKPLSAYPDEVAELQALAREKGVLFREAIMLLYQPQLPILRQAVADCGNIRMAHFDFCQLSSKYEAYCRGECPNIFDPALHAGTLMDLGVYCVYPALYLFGEPHAVEATATFLDTGADGSGSALLSYPDKTVSLTYTKTGQGVAGSQIVGDRGAVHIGAISTLSQMTLHRPDGTQTVLWDKEDKPILMGREIAAFAKEAMGDIPCDDEKDRLALAVSRCMAAIRRQAGIHFPEDRERRI